MKTEILSVAPLYQPCMDRLERDFTVHKLWQAADRDALLAEVAPRVRGMQAGGASIVPASLIDALPKLEIVSVFGVGYDGIDLEAAKRRNITVTNTPDVLNDCVADLAMGLLIAAARRLAEADRYVRAGKWLEGPMPLATKVSGKRLGIVGFGRIGRTIAKRAAGFDMEIAYHSRRPVADAPHRHYPSLVELARDSDFLVVITPGGAGTFHLIDERVLRALGPKGILVNVARGSVVDEKTLVKVLAEGALGGAALDVFEDEPNVPPALLAMDNVVLAPHVGSATHETRAAMGNLCVDNLVAHFAGRPVLTRVV
ncbi:MAG: 2-hydroxyacid dehydrogenase [Burkholderiales bacterium]|nr:2-hydroxyacid dehydrogenase [Burkholderiales bacterium]